MHDVLNARHADQVPRYVGHRLADLECVDVQTLGEGTVQVAENGGPCDGGAPDVGAEFDDHLWWGFHGCEGFFGDVELGLFEVHETRCAAVEVQGLVDGPGVVG